MLFLLCVTFSFGGCRSIFISVILPTQINRGSCVSVFVCVCVFSSALGLVALLSLAKRAPVFPLCMPPPVFTLFFWSLFSSVSVFACVGSRRLRRSGAWNCTAYFLATTLSIFVGMEVFA